MGSAVQVFFSVQQASLLFLHWSFAKDNGNFTDESFSEWWLQSNACQYYHLVYTSDILCQFFEGTNIGPW